MHRLSALRGGFLVLLMLCAPLSGCIGEKDGIENDEIGDFLIDSMKPSQAKLYTGQWHDFLLVGQGKAISVPTSVMLFVNGTVISNGYAVVEGDQLTGRLLLTPYSNNVILTIVDSDGKGKSYEMDIEQGTPIVSGKEWFTKMDYITSVCGDSNECGGYINRWMGSPNPAFERAASYFLGHFQGLGYEASLMRVSDTLSFTQPESLNVIAWKRGYDDTCVQGIGAHMDIAPLLALQVAELTRERMITRPVR